MLVGVLILDHFFDFALIVGDDPAIGSRVGGAKTQHDCPGVRAVVQPENHVAHRVCADHRYIAVQDQHITRETFECVMRLRHRVAGAELVFLHRDRDIAACDAFLDLLPPRTNNDYGALDANGIDGIEQMVEHRLACNRMQYLVRLRLHSGALSCGEDNCG